MMKDKMIINARGLGYDYYNHKIFAMLSDLESFYGFLSDSSFGNVDGLFLTQKISYQNKIYASMQGSIESIKMCIPVDTRSPFPVIPVHSVGNLQYMWQS